LNILILQKESFGTMSQNPRKAPNTRIRLYPPLPGACGALEVHVTKSEEAASWEPPNIRVGKKLTPFFSGKVQQ
jgi:hypothetical protein